MPRVLRVVTRLNRGGPLRQLTALVPALQARGWDGPVLAGGTDPTEPDGTRALEDRGVEVIRLPSLRRGIDPLRDARALREIMRAIRNTQPDLLHTHLGKAGALGRSAARALGIPVVHTLHGHHFDAGGLRARGARAAERILGRLGDALICLSERQRRDVVERHGVVAAERVHVIEPGLDVRALDAAARGPGLPATAPDGKPGALRLIWTGRFVPVKRPLALLDVVEAMQAPVQLTAYGEGPLRAGFLEAIRRRGLSDQVRAPGAIDEVAPALLRADVLLLTSASEGVSLSMLEALVLGVPVVVPAVGGLPDVIVDGETGRLVPPGDDAALARAIDQLAADPAGRRALAGRGRDMARTRFAAGRLADETAALYGALVRPASSPHDS